MSLYRKLVNFVWMFLYVYNIDFAFIPGLLRTRPIIGAWGAIVEVLRPKKLWCNVYTNIILLQCLYFVVTGITTAVNHHFDFWFSRHAILDCSYLIAAIYIMRKFPAATFKLTDVVRLVATVITVQNIIAFIGYNVPALSDFITSIQSFESDDMIEFTRQRGVRIIGLGMAQFFHGGAISGLGVIAYCYLIKERAISVVRGGILLMTTLLTGMFIARTTFIGLVGLLFFVHFNFATFRRAVKLLLTFALSVAIIYGIYLQFFADKFSLDWAFEFIINAINGGEVETESTNELKTMWRLPSDLKTWVIGDGRFTDQFGHYYKRTDVGYLRTIYDLGLVGLAVTFAIQIYMAKALYKLSGYSRSVLKLGIVLVIYVAALYVKGLADVNYFFFLLIANEYNRQLYFKNLPKERLLSSNQSKADELINKRTFLHI